MFRFLRFVPTALLLATPFTGPPLRALAPAVALADEPSAGADESQAVLAAEDDQQPPQRTTDLGQSTGLLLRDKLVLDSAVQVDLDKETVHLPLYKNTANNQAESRSSR